MTSQRLVVGLLSVIAVALVVIAAVLVLERADQPRKHSPEWEAAHERAEGEAEIYCTLGGVVPGMTSLHDPAYKQCVKDETADDMDVWEKANPEDVWQ